MKRRFLGSFSRTGLHSLTLQERAAREAREAKVREEMARQQAEAAAAAASSAAFRDLLPPPGVGSTADSGSDDATHAASVLAKVQQIRDRCRGQPFVDADFQGSTAVGSPKYDAAPRWARMGEMSGSPAIVEGGTFSPDRLTQGEVSYFKPPRAWRHRVHR